MASRSRRRKSDLKKHTHTLSNQTLYLDDICHRNRAVSKFKREKLLSLIKMNISIINMSTQTVQCVYVYTFYFIVVCRCYCCFCCCRRRRRLFAPVSFQTTKEYSSETNRHISTCQCRTGSSFYSAYTNSTQSNPLSHNIIFAYYCLIYLSVCFFFLIAIEMYIYSSNMRRARAHSPVLHTV